MSSDHSGSSTGGNQTSLDSLKDQAGETVSEVASHLKQEAARREEGIRGSVSKQADDLAAALRSAKSDIDPQSSIGKMLDYAADSVGSIAENLKSADTGEMVDGIRSFARERPGAFLGAAALAGFAAARFFVASAPAGSRGGSGSYGSSGTRSSGMSGNRSGMSSGRPGSATGYGGSGQSQAGTSSYGSGTSTSSGSSGFGTGGGTSTTSGSSGFGTGSGAGTTSGSSGFGTGGGAGTTRTTPGSYSGGSSTEVGSSSTGTGTPGQGIKPASGSDGGRND